MKKIKNLNIFENSTMKLVLLIFGYLLTVLTLFNTFQILNINNTLGITQILSVILPILLLLKNNKLNKKTGIIIIIYVFIILVMPFMYNKTYDLTIDGNTYHKTAIAFIKNGWNPVYESSWDFQEDNGKIVKFDKESKIDLWIDHYPKATWIVAATIYNMTGNIESGKCITLILSIALGLLAYNCLNLIVSKKWAFIISTLLILNPITLAQIFTYYLDSIMGICFVCELLLLFMIDPMKKQDFKIWFLLISICSIFVNLKFTGLLYSGVIAATFYFYWIIKYKRQKDFFKKFLIITRNFIIVYLIAILLVGSNSYIKNTIEHKNPLYPLIGKDKVDIITTMQPNSFAKKNMIEKFFISTFSKTENVTYNGGEPSLKIPFLIYKSEIDALSIPDIRIGGFGPYFALLIIVSFICLIIITNKIYKYEKNNLKYIGLSLLTIIISMILVGENWWARYVPQLYLVIVGTLLLLIYTTKYFKNQKINKIITIVFTMVITINLLMYYNTFKNNISYFKNINNDIKELKKKNTITELKTTTEGNYGYYYNLNDAKIDYKVVKKIDEKDKRFMYSWRLEVKK